MAVTRTTRLLVALGINLALVGAQIGAGLAAHSAGLLADAGHNLTDVAAIGLSLAAVRWALRPRTDARTYGNHRGTILAALANSAVLAVVTVAIVVEGAVRLAHPVNVDGAVTAAVAGAAVLANGVAALVLHERGHELNMRSALVHMVGDMAASLAVLAGGVAIVVGGPAFDRADPAASLVVAVLILVEALRIAKESADVLLESTPSDVDLDALRRAITGVPGVGEVHDLHVWSLSSEYRALSAHLVLTGHPSLEEAQAVGNQVRDGVSGPFDIAHATFELECERCDDALEDPCGVDEHHPEVHHPEVHRPSEVQRSPGA